MNGIVVFQEIAKELGGNWEVEREFSSNFSRIYFLVNRVQQKRLVVKDVVPAMFDSIDDIDDRVDLASRLNSNTLKFRELLRAHEVRLTREFFTIVSDGCRGTLHVASHEGMDCAERLQDSLSAGNARLIIRGILENMKGVLNQRSPVTVGSDLQLGNFSAGFRYTDIFPPLFFDPDNGEYIVHEPQPTDPEEIHRHVERKFYVGGTLRRFRFFTLSFSKHFEEIWMEEVERALDEAIWKEVRDFLECLPDKRLQFDSQGMVTRDSLLKVLADIPIHDVDSLRDIGIRVVPDCLERSRILHQVFRCARNPGPGDQEDPRDQLEGMLFQFTA